MEVISHSGLLTHRYRVCVCVCVCVCVSMESFFLIEVWLIYSVVLVSGVQKRDTFFLRFFSIIVYYKGLNIAPCAIQ